MKFAYAKTHPLCEPSWLLVIEDAELLMEIHKKVSVRLAVNYGSNPHGPFHENGEPKKGREIDAFIYHPVRLGAGWLGTALNFFMEKGKVYMNRNSGMTCPTELIAETEFPAWEWPDAKPIPGEYVSISQWSGGKSHFYLSSNKGRIFPVDKCDTMEEVQKLVSKHAPGAKILTGNNKVPHFYKQEGD